MDLHSTRHKIRVALALLLLGGGLLFSGEAQARPPENAEFKAAETLGMRMAEWTLALDPRPKSVGIFAVYANTPFDQDYAAIMEAEVIKHLSHNNLERVASCSECRSPQLKVEGENLVVRKGIPDLESLKTIGERQPVEVFITIDIYRTAFQVSTQLTAYRNPTGELLGSERFSAPAVTFNDTSVQLITSLGLGKPLDATAATTDYLLGIHLALLEEVGFGKAGLALGMISGGLGGSILYVDPTLSLGGYFGSTGLAYAFHTGVGFGLLGAARALHLRGSLELLLGSWTIVGVDINYFLPTATLLNTTQSYFGLHMGFVLGK